MIRWLEIGICAALALAAHLAFFVARPPTGAQAGGAGGEALVSIQAAPASVAAMVAKWERPVTAQSAVQTLQIPRALDPSAATLRAPSAPQPTPRAPRMAPAQAAPAADPIQLDTRPATPTPPKPAPKAAPKPSPKPAPKPAPKPRPSQAGQAGQKASGSGGGDQAGTTAKARVATVSKGEQAKLRQVWGAKIRSKIARAQRFPRSLRATGTSVVRLRVGRDGRLLGVTLARSSGDSALDQAAMASVRRAKRFSKAPKALPGDSFTFVLPIEKKR